MGSGRSRPRQLSKRIDPLPDLDGARLRSSKPIDPSTLPRVDPHELSAFVDESAATLQAEYRRIRRRATEDPGTAGDEGANNWAQILRDWLPGAFPVVTKGRILSDDGRLSPQLDVLVLRSGYPAALVQKKTYLAAGVLAAFECKLTLKAEHVREAARTARVLRDLVRTHAGTPYDELHSPLVFGLLAHQTSIRRDPLGSIDRVLRSELATDSHPREMMDVLAVADLSTWRAFTVLLPRALFGPGEWDATREVNNLAADGSITRHYMRALPGVTTPPAPLFELIEYLVNRIAWEHPEHRFLAEYWIRAGHLSAGAVVSRSWDFDVLSETVRARVTAGGLTNGDRWGAWSMTHQT
jgi:hypothetical protein